MKAWLLDEPTGISRLRLADVPEPVAREGEAVLEIHYAGLNPADRYLAEGQYPARPTFPHILGRDGVGTVTQIGPGVTGVAVGDVRAILRGEVGVNRAGTLAAKVAVPVENLVPIPSGWNECETAGAALVYLTAFQALTMWGALPSSAIVLVTGASGGVGVASVQLAAAMGHTVVAQSRSADKGARLRGLGAKFVLNPQDAGWGKNLKSLLAPRRVDLAIDSVGGKLLPEVIETLGDQGRVSLVGRLAGPVPNFNTATLFFRRIRIGGVAVGAYSPAECQANWKLVLELMSRTGARPLVDRIFPFEQLSQAFERLQQGPMGKVLVEVAAARGR